jgi:hypothetical protein
MDILENPRVLTYLKKRKLIKQYIKARIYFENDHFEVFAVHNHQ